MQNLVVTAIRNLGFVHPCTIILENLVVIAIWNMGFVHPCTIILENLCTQADSHPVQSGSLLVNYYIYKLW